jgi:TatD DNase family protein
VSPAPTPLASLPIPTADAHAHLDAMAERAGAAPDQAFVAAALARARAVGVLGVITVGDSIPSSAWCAQAAGEHTGLFAAVAVHPNEVAGLDADGYAELERLARLPRVVAVGETGLDYYWDRTTPAQQQEHFRRHIDLAKRVGKPLVIHDREAHADVLRILSEERAPEKVIFHSFSGDAEMARQCARAGYVLSFSGVITFRNAPGLRMAAAAVPTEQVLVETDAPFLTPDPFRGKPNAPYLLPYTVAALAQAQGVPMGRLLQAMQVTAGQFFGAKFAEETV